MTALICITLLYILSNTPDTTVINSDVEENQLKRLIPLDLKYNQKHFGSGNDHDRVLEDPKDAELVNNANKVIPKYKKAFEFSGKMSLLKFETIFLIDF